MQMGLMVLGQKSISGMLARYDLHLAHMLVLNGLAGTQPGIPTAPLGQPGQRITLSMSDISRALDMPPASATAMIDRLTARSLVERIPSPQDRRMVLVTLTEDGRELTRQFQQHWKQLQLDAYDVISDEHLQDHLHLMQRLHQQYLIRSGTPDDRVPAPPPPEDSP
ncbi:hypothetical protein GCM10008957_11980 [Deinococcus ruber]|uniref:HTH marR-type domain-containing protein n=1 Tax=Deinococcus ruber TaxID=1848197 RepID=A0A918C230_9DEIO|nr:hypothetical protein GCM10008957_11980 [Deinococcus ruber]